MSRPAPTRLSSNSHARNTSISGPFPDPPVFTHSSLRIPSYFRYQHSLNKSMINMIRTGVNGRLQSMTRERPELFQQFYQIPDVPEEITSDLHDTQRLFHSRAILYLNPLCLAIYMKKEQAANAILVSGLNGPDDCSYATFVFQKNGYGDILQLFPMCILIKREYFEVLPLLLTEWESTEEADSTTNPAIRVAKRSLKLHYVAANKKKIFKFQDLFQYSLETLKRNSNYNIGRFMDALLNGSYLSTGGKGDFDQAAGDQEYKTFIQTLFHRILQVIYNDDADGAITPKLMKCLESLLRMRCFAASPKKLFPMDASKGYHVITIDPQSCHNECSLALLFCIYDQALQRQKLAFLDKLGILIYRMLSQFEWLSLLKQLPVMVLRQICMDLPEKNVTFSQETIALIGRHMDLLAQKEYLNKENSGGKPGSGTADGATAQSGTNSTPFTTGVFLPDYRRQQALRRLLLADAHRNKTVIHKSTEKLKKELINHIDSVSSSQTSHSSQSRSSSSQQSSATSTSSSKSNSQDSSSNPILEHKSTPKFLDEQKLFFTAKQNPREALLRRFSSSREARNLTHQQDNNSKHPVVEYSDEEIEKPTVQFQHHESSSQRTYNSNQSSPTLFVEETRGQPEPKYGSQEFACQHEYASHSEGTLSLLENETFFNNDLDTFKSCSHNQISEIFFSEDEEEQLWLDTAKVASASSKSKVHDDPYGTGGDVFATSGQPRHSIYRANYDENEIHRKFTHKMNGGKANDFTLPHSSNDMSSSTPSSVFSSL